MFGGDLYRHSLLRAALFSAAFVVVICLSQQQEVQDELRDKHVTSPLIEGSDFLHVGDMTIFRGQYEADEVGTRQERHVTKSLFAKWPRGVVPYEISSQFTSSQRQVILRAIEHWEDNTCINFRPKVAGDVYSIYIMRDRGCYSFVGRLSRRYQPQGVSLGSGCVHYSIVIHELGHVIGFYHEHTRPDRDQYIDVIYDNIQRGFEDQFYKYRDGETDTLGLGYDIRSIMHYERDTFSRDGSDTIRPKVPGTSVGNARQLSTLDIAKANRFYGCVSATPSPPPPPPPPTPPPCGGVLNTASGSFQTPNWPSTYPVNVDCEWRIRLPNARKLVELNCDHDPFGIAGYLPGCDKDHLKFYDGHSTRDRSHGPYCHFTPPEVLKMSSNLVMAVFHSGPSHSSSRKGFRCTFQSVEAPTPPTTLPPTPPPTTPPPCGGELKTTNGSFQSPNWPITYPVNLDCQWTIELPDRTKLVEIDCNNEPFGIAGSLPACDRDHLKFYDGHSIQDKPYGPYCHFTKPEIVKMSTNLAMAVFHAGPSHSPSRLGFKCTFRSVDGPTTPPPPPSPITTLPPPSTKAPSPPTTSVSPPTSSTALPPPPPSPGACPLQIVPTNPVGTYCDSYMVIGTYFGLPGFPSPVGQSTPSDCDFTIISAAGNTKYQVRITYFDLPASSDCSSHSLTIYDGLNESHTQLAKLCGDICQEQVFQLSGGFAFVKVHMATRPGTFRGFQAIVEEVP